MQRFFIGLPVVMLVFVSLFILTRHETQIKQKTAAVFRLSTDHTAATSIGTEIAKDMETGVKTQVATVKEKAMDVKVSDAVGFVGRIKRIPQDVRNMKNYVVEKIQEVLGRRQ